MANYNCTTKTMTEVVGSKVKVHCFSDMNPDGSRTPTLYYAEILQEPKEINGVRGIEGELILVHQDSGSIGCLNNRGELIITLKDDNPHRYKLDLENLVYEYIGRVSVNVSKVILNKENGNKVEVEIESNTDWNAVFTAL